MDLLGKELPIFAAVPSATSVRRSPGETNRIIDQLRHGLDSIFCSSVRPSRFVPETFSSKMVATPCRCLAPPTTIGLQFVWPQTQPVVVVLCDR
jgi:hypothetical protein